MDEDNELSEDFLSNSKSIDNHEELYWDGNCRYKIKYKNSVLIKIKLN